jgi:hypothetical protein
VLLKESNDVKHVNETENVGLVIKDRRRDDVGARKRLEHSGDWGAGEYNEDDLIGDCHLRDGGVVQEVHRVLSRKQFGTGR